MRAVLSFHPVTGQRTPVLHGLDLEGARALLPKHRCWRFDPRTGGERHPDDVLYDPFLEVDQDCGRLNHPAEAGWLLKRLVLATVAGAAAGMAASVACAVAGRMLP
jgi:hypothetical protein